MVTEAELIQIFRRYFPEPDWKVWVHNPGVLNQFMALAITGVIDGKTCGSSYQLTGSKPIKTEKVFETYYDPWADVDVTGWHDVVLESKHFNLLKERSAEEWDQIAKTSASRFSHSRR